VLSPQNLRNVYVGTSGWSLGRDLAPGSSPELSGLQRYAEYFNAVEINTTFYRLPRPGTIRRWESATPPDFRFAVKLPRSITHEARLVGVEVMVREFCQLCEGFGEKLGPLLVQLPPSLVFDAGVAGPFLEAVARATRARVVLEPRHQSWFSESVERLLSDHGIARAAADPACCPAAALPAPSRGLCYFRWHGAPKCYFSAYQPEAIAHLADSILRARVSGGGSALTYCFLDNTALGAAPVNALSLKSRLVMLR
jgi:uncharacterized protein YecE (DUF72 family)